MRVGVAQYRERAEQSGDGLQRIWPSAAAWSVPGRIALSRSMNPSGVLETNSRAVSVEMSVVDPSGSVSFTASPAHPRQRRHGCAGSPDPFEKRKSAGTGAAVEVFCARKAGRLGRSP